MRDLLTTVLVIGPSTTSSGWLMEKARPARNPPDTVKLEAGSKLQIPLPISRCRAGVSASIEDRDGKGRATPSPAPTRRQMRTCVAVSSGLGGTKIRPAGMRQNSLPPVVDSPLCVPHASARECLGEQGCARRDQ